MKKKIKNVLFDMYGNEFKLTKKRKIILYNLLKEIEKQSKFKKI